MSRGGIRESLFHFDMLKESVRDELQVITKKEVAVEMEYNYRVNHIPFFF